METKTPLAEGLLVTTSPVCPLLTDPTPGLTTGSRIQKVQTDAGRLSHRKHAYRKHVSPQGRKHSSTRTLCSGHIHSRFGVWQKKEIIRFTDEKKKIFFFKKKLLVFLKKALGK